MTAEPHPCTPNTPVREHHRTLLDGLWLASIETPASADAEQALPVVLVHGLGMSARTYEALMDELAGGPRLVALDLPGCGNSSSGGSIATPTELAGLLWAWLDARGLDRVVLVGHSLGCQVITRLAAQRPGRVASLILLSPAPDPEAGGAFQTTLRLVAGAVFEPVRFFRYAIVDFIKARLHRSFRVLMQAMTVLDYDIVRSVEAPALIIRGDRDAVSTAAGARRLAETYPDARMEEIPKSAHAIHIDAADRIAPVVRRVAQYPDRTA